MRPAQARELRLPDFTKLAPQFTGQSPDPMVAENWVNEVEKTFKAFEVPEASKMSLAEFQLKERGNDWWVAKKASMRDEVDWAGFKVLFYEKYFPESTKDKILSQILALQQGNRTVSEYEAEFNRLVKFTPEGIKDNERTKMQKFRDGMNLDLQLDVRGCDVTTLGALVNKAKAMEEVRDKMKAKEGGSGKRPDVPKTSKAIFLKNNDLIFWCFVF